MSSAPCLWKNPSQENKRTCFKPVWAAGQGYCLEHKPAPWTGGKKRVHSPLFQRNRRTIHQKYKGVCQQCGGTGNQVDHIKPVMDGGSDDLYNLTLLCIDCHKIKSEEENKRAIYGAKPKKRG